MSREENMDFWLAFALSERVFEHIGGENDLLIAPLACGAILPIIEKMARLEAFIEKSGDEVLIRDFQAVGSIIANALVIENDSLRVFGFDGDKWFMGEAPKGVH